MPELRMDSRPTKKGIYTMSLELKDPGLTLPQAKQLIQRIGTKGTSPDTGQGNIGLWEGNDPAKGGKTFYQVEPPSNDQLWAAYQIRFRPGSAFAYVPDPQNLKVSHIHQSLVLFEDIGPAGWTPTETIIDPTTGKFSETSQEGQTLIVAPGEELIGMPQQGIAGFPQDPLSEPYLVPTYINGKLNGYINTLATLDPIYNVKYGGPFPRGIGQGPAGTILATARPYIIRGLSVVVRWTYIYLTVRYLLPHVARVIFSIGKYWTQKALDAARQAIGSSLAPLLLLAGVTGGAYLLTA